MVLWSIHGQGPSILINHLWLNQNTSSHITLRNCELLCDSAVKTDPLCVNSDVQIMQVRDDFLINGLLSGNYRILYCLSSIQFDYSSTVTASLWYHQTRWSNSHKQGYLTPQRSQISPHSKNHSVWISRTYSRFISRCCVWYPLVSRQPPNLNSICVQEWG